MTKWRSAKFDDLVRLKRGYDLPTQNIVEGEYPVVTSSEIKAKHNKFKSLPPGVVTGRSGTLGVVQYIDEKFWPLNTSLYAKDFRGNLPKYIYYFLSEMKLENFNAGAGVPTLNQNHLQKLPINIPELETQKKIAAILSAYDDLIENNKRRIALLENMAEEIYREWFVRFRFPGYQTAEFEKGIPKGWKNNILGDIIELAYGKSLKADDRVEGVYPVYGSSGIVGYHNKAFVIDGGIIVGRKGNVGSVHWSKKGFFPIDTVYYVKASLPNGFIFYALKSMNFINNDSAVPGLNRNQAYSNKLLLPDLDLIDMFWKFTQPMFEQIDILTCSNEILERTKKELLPRLISGRLSVADLDILFPPSMQTTAAAEERVGK